VIFASRGPRGDDGHLEWKVQLFFVGAALGLVGMALDSSFMVGLAIVALVGGVVLRFFQGPPRDSCQEDSEEGLANEEGDST
jgi:hypothetical protein